MNNETKERINNFLKIWKALKVELSKPFCKYIPYTKYKKATKADHLFVDFKKAVGVNTTNIMKNGCYLCLKKMEC